SDISCGGTQSGSAATVTLHEIVCNDWFGSVVFVSGSRDIHARRFDFLQADVFSFRIYSFAPSLPYISDMVLIFSG
ncbi:hypothetical protein, partial [Rariglobus hedericola]|uniref:hypothetical protein n=1 Tax=Rariglobus hedericola TaxID=2597822 RepID=UPI0019395D87